LTLLLFCSFILNVAYLSTYLLCCDVVASCSLFDVIILVPCFKLVFPPLSFFVGVGGAVQIQIFHVRLGK
jgi:hypothetical protein